MARRRFLLLPLFLTACMACGQEPTPTTLGQDGAGDLAGPTGEVACPADEYQGFVGTSIAAVTYPSDLNVRVVEPGMMVTQDYVPERMNIHLDEDGTITKVACG
jgi:hypothetical protein